jgi:2-polyprenyl-6-methoxyphenol hydroxylase-like FAD-dependent oxidoreductase
LARAGWSIALVERKAFPRGKVCGEYLSLSNLPLFDRLGIGGRFRDLAGPPVRKVGLFAGATMLQADLPRGQAGWGRALSREQLDTWLRDESLAAGADLWQPWTIDALTPYGNDYCSCRLRSTAERARASLDARLVIAAHGSWESGSLPTQPARPVTRGNDLLAFKAHFTNSDLPEGLMPLLAFPGGYGGMVRCEGGRVSLSCCVRRDTLTSIRRCQHGDAGDAVLAHIAESCVGVRQALAAARRDGAWLAAGPIRPGIRVDQSAGLFVVGNAAGEAHPVVAEGISMALQSSWLLTELLIAWKKAGGNRATLRDVQRDYAARWRTNFAARIWASLGIAQWAMHTTPQSITRPVLWCFPALLTWGARISGKTHVVVR